MKGLNKLGLLLLPFAALATSCGSSRSALAMISKGVYKDTYQEDENESQKYTVKRYSFGITSGSAISVTKNDFKVKTGSGTEMTAECLLSNVTSHWTYDETEGWIEKNYYKKVVASVEIPGESEVDMTSVYAAFTNDGSVTNSCEFYFKGIQITTSAEIIDFKA